MSLEHPNVVPIHDAGEVGSRLYLAMRLVEGTDLGALLREEAPLEPARALAVCSQVAKALDAAHAIGLVHRDVKPLEHPARPARARLSRGLRAHRRLDEHGLTAGDGRSGNARLPGARADRRRADRRSRRRLLARLRALRVPDGGTPFAGDSRLAVAWAHMEEEPPSASEHQSELSQSVDRVIRRAHGQGARGPLPDLLGVRRRCGGGVRAQAAQARPDARRARRARGPPGGDGCSRGSAPPRRRVRRR